jgi:hypothetical protein
MRSIVLDRSVEGGSSSTAIHKTLIVVSDQGEFRNLQRGATHVMMSFCPTPIGTIVALPSSREIVRGRSKRNWAYRRFSPLFEYNTIMPRFKFEWRRRLAENFDRCSSRFRSMTEGIVVRFLRPRLDPLNVHREIRPQHQEPDFIAWSWASTEKRDRVCAGRIKYTSKSGTEIGFFQCVDRISVNSRRIQTHARRSSLSHGDCRNTEF